MVLFMEFNIQNIGDSSIITINKDQLLGVENQSFQTLIQDSINAGSKNIVVDLSNVKFVTSLGIESFIHARKSCNNNNINFTLKNVNPGIMNVLSTLKLTDLFMIS
jgi:anti-anti-sigma factor